MSVINQMLKDLDQRQQDENNIVTGSAVQISPSTKPWLIITITVLVTLAIMVAVYFFFQNKQLKQSLTQNKHSSNLQIAKLLVEKKQKSQVAQPQTSKPQKLKNQITNALLQVKVTQSDQPIKPITQQTVIKPETQKEKVVVEKISQLKQTTTLKSGQQKMQQPSNALESDLLVKGEDKTIFQPVKPSMSVSRKRVSAEQLAKQKMAKAEELILANEPKSAEALFEEVLMLTPNNKVARKQLAALWFGRKAFQNALNLLSQGLSLDQNDSEFRLMQARIYLNQGKNEKAYQVLQAFEQSNDIEYLVTLANVAQQLAKYQQAILSYQHLANLQPNEARWWLGLAVAYDRNSQYKLAIPAYQSAVVQGNLSNSAMQFAKQRLQELEE